MANLSPEQEEILKKAVSSGVILTPQLVSYLLHVKPKEVPVEEKENIDPGLSALKKVSLKPIRGSLCI